MKKTLEYIFIACFAPFGAVMVIVAVWALSFLLLEDLLQCVLKI